MGLDIEHLTRDAGNVGAGVASENSRLTPRQKLRFAALVLILFVAIPVLLGKSPYFITVLTNAAILSFISLGVWITFSIGRMNLAQGAFALVGGYTSAILATRYGFSFWFCLPLSGLISAALGALIGWPVLRLKGVYFAMTTLSLTEAIRLLALNGGDITKGATGIVNVPRPGAIGFVGFTIVPEFGDCCGVLRAWFRCVLLNSGTMVKPPKPIAQASEYSQSRWRPW